MTECYSCCKSEKGLEQGHNRSSSGPLTRSERMIFVAFCTLRGQNNKILIFHVLSDTSGPACLCKMGCSRFFRGNFKCPERF